MKINIYTSNYEVIDHGTVFLFDENSDLTFDIDTGKEFSFQLTIKFINDDNGKQIINRTINLENKVITMECLNFLSSGTGTSKPIEIATVKGKKIYLSFWMYLEGDYEGKDKTRSLKYTFFLER